jgi:dipeptidyl aminopeptidase/acylaminoacyl peptidase
MRRVLPVLLIVTVLGFAPGLAPVGGGARATARNAPLFATQPAAGAAAAPLAEMHTLAYHQITAWSAAANDRGEEAPILSDDGQRIAFARAPGTEDPANPNRIFLINADGSGEREIDAYTTFCYCGSLIDLSADGSRVVSSDSMQLRVADATGSGGRELLALDSNEINAVRITGDGNTVVFRLRRGVTMRNTAPTQTLEVGVYAVNADGSNLRQVAGPAHLAPLLGIGPEQISSTSVSSGLDVSFDGSRMVFAGFSGDADPAAGGAFREALFAVNGDGSELHRLLGPTFTHVTANAISGDGSTVAYVTQDFGTGLQEAGVLDFDGGGQRTLTDSTSTHPGTGANLPSGERIQLTTDGARLLLGSTGLLYDTSSGEVFALGVSTPGYSTDPAPLVGDGLYRATMNAEATRVLYLFPPSGAPYQLARLDLNPADLDGAPSVTGASLTPDFLLSEGRSSAAVSALVSTSDAIQRVSSRALREGLPDDNVRAGPLLDDGTGAGDAAAEDGLFTNTGLMTDCCAVIGPRTLRIKAETEATDGIQDATAIDVAPFAVVASGNQAPPPPTPGAQKDDG